VKSLNITSSYNHITLSLLLRDYFNYSFCWRIEIYLHQSWKDSSWNYIIKL